MFLFFCSDIRPTFLFWARGGPVALLRGANRPLLTRLIQEEVVLEYTEAFRPPLEIDFNSEKVIQCSGDLAQLENDDIIRSIGCGNTDKLSSFYHETDSNIADHNYANSTKNTEKTLQNINEGTQDQH